MLLGVTTSPRAPVRRQARHLTRQELLDAADRVFAARGIAAASIDDVVAEAGYTRGAFYSSFRDKDDIVQAVAGRYLERVLEILRELLEADPTPEALIEGITGADAPGWEGPAARLYSEELVVRALHDEALRVQLARQHAQLRDGLARAIERVWGHLPVDSLDVATVVLSVAQGAVRAELLDPRVDADRLVRDVALPLLTAGLERKGARPRTRRG